jgi:transposase
VAGRPSKLTDDVQERLLRMLQAGVYQDAAADAAGVGRSTYYAWLERGRRERERLAGDARRKAKPDERRYLDFLDAVETARGTAEVRYTLAIQQAAQRGTWQAAAWWLERSFPDRYGRRERRDGDVDGLGAIDLYLDGLRAS